MKYQIYKMSFTTGVHFGTGSLTRGTGTFMADTLFSALCIEAVKMGADYLKKLVNAVDEGQIYLSDGLPFIGQTYYVPKPMMELGIERENNSTVKKALKNLSYIPIDQMNRYLDGEMDIQAEEKIFQNGFGSSTLLEKTAISFEGSIPYAVNVFTYGENAGLYEVIAYENDEALSLVEELLISLSMVGIGGKRSSGYGKFSLKKGKMPEELLKRIDGIYHSYMILSTSLPSDNELDRVIPEAGYRLVKRSGFISSETYAAQAQKKRDVYLMQSGSVVNVRFQGTLLDVSENGAHPVYRYAKPILMGVI